MKHITWQFTDIKHLRIIVLSKIIRVGKYSVSSAEN